MYLSQTSYLALIISGVLHFSFFTFVIIVFQIQAPKDKPQLYFLGQILASQDIYQKSSRSSNSLSRQSNQLLPLKRLKAKAAPANLKSAKPIFNKPLIKSIEKNTFKPTLEPSMSDQIPDPSTLSEFQIEIPEIQYQPLRLQDE